MLKKQLIIDDILLGITPQGIEKTIQQVQNVVIPSYIKKWVDEYQKVGERKIFIWRGFLEAKQALDYFSIPKKYENILREAEFLIAMFFVLLDDVADEKKDEKLFNGLAEIPFTNKKNNNAHFKFTKKVWQRIIFLLKKAPYYEEAKSFFEFDIKQAINAFGYDFMINKNPVLINKTESWLYSPHSMQFLFNASVYLMFVPLPKNLGSFRQINWLMLKMARIGNWLYTWQREAKVGDFTSGVFVYAIESGLLVAEDLSKMKSESIIKKIKDSEIEKKLFHEWWIYYKELENFEGKTPVDIPKLMMGLKKIINLENSLANKK